MEDPFPDPTETNAMIERAWVSAAENENLRASVERKPSLNIASELRSYHHRIRSHLYAKVQSFVLRYYKLSQLSPDFLAQWVNYLLEDDQFQCDESHYEPASYRFSAARIPRLISKQFFSRPGVLGLLDLSFLSSMNRNLICLVSTTICWALRAHSTAHFVKPSNFNRENCLELMVEEIVQQTLGQVKKSGLSVPESETTEALLDPGRDSLIQTLRNKHFAALAQQSQVNWSRQRSQKRPLLSSHRNQNQPPQSNSPHRRLTPPSGNSSDNSGEWDTAENERAHGSDDNHDNEADNNECDDQIPTIEILGSRDLSDVSDGLE
ncbi:hypothetical protein Q9L58_002674 [Maublancomyces gigas]|uniref:DUF6532 domain-containing protein n=1 Tax=Discina gigas TaxID=1032678 RepID=A0ABR3GR13_9PEZI